MELKLKKVVKQETLEIKIRKGFMLEPLLYLLLVNDGGGLSFISFISFIDLSLFSR